MLSVFLDSQWRKLIVADGDGWFNLLSQKQKPPGAGPNTRWPPSAFCRQQIVNLMHPPATSSIDRLTHARTGHESYKAAEVSVIEIVVGEIDGSCAAARSFRLTSCRRDSG